MAKKLIDQEEAARMLGITVDELNSMRDRKQVFPTRDGGAWKYKQDELERILRERETEKEGSWSDELSLEDVSLDLGDPESVVIADAGEGLDTGNSTIVGKATPATGSTADTGSDLQLADFETGSDVRLASDSVILSGPSPSKPGSGLLDDITIDTTGSDKLLGSGSLELAEDEIKLAGSDIGQPAGSSTKKGKGSDLKLAADEELVLDPESGSDITIGGGDSGISLVDPNDSGLSLEQPLELEGSNVESLELGEEDVISLEEDIDVEGATELKADEDFMLTPVEEAADDTDSGSQVIALDADEEFGAGFGGSATGLEEDLGAAAPLVGAGLAPAAALATAPGLAPSAYAYEPPFTVWNFVSLLACALFLLVGGMFMYDLVRNMWSWDSPYGFSSAMMDGLVGIFG